MKKSIILLGLFISISSLIAQNPAILELESNVQGILIPRMTDTERNAIANPVQGLLVYQTNAPEGFYFYNGTEWSLVGKGAGGTIQGTGVNALNIRATNQGTVAGAARGENSVDLQSERIHANQVASGANSVVSGGSQNRASAANAFVGGGKNNAATDSQSTVGGGFSNEASGIESTVGGGQENTASGNRSTISGGRKNKSTGLYSSIGGGNNNFTSDQSSSIAGGEENVASGNQASIGGGKENTASGTNSTVAGGRNNQSKGNASAIPGGEGLISNSYGEAVVGLYNENVSGNASNHIGTDAAFVVGVGTSGANRKNALVVEKDGDVGIGTNNPDESLHVIGNIKMVDGNEASGKVLTSDASGSGSWMNLPADMVDDADADPTNELQNLGSVLSEGNDAGGAKITNLMDPAADQDAATKKYVDDNDDVNDADSDAGNEIQTLDVAQLNGTNLELSLSSDGEATKSINLASLQDGTGTDDQTLSEVLTQGNSAGNMKITNLMDPAADQDAATKKYVDDSSGGSNTHVAYGTGSSGVLTISSNTNWTTTPPVGGYQFTDFIINAGQTLTVPSGTVIRCTGSFTNNGSIIVTTGALGGSDENFGLPNQVSEPTANINILRNALSDKPGIAHSESIIRTILNPGYIAGGGGDDGNGSPNKGGDGGGSIVIRCKAAFTNTGSITANGINGDVMGPDDDPGGGGGGGGWIIIASSTSITNSGSLIANGGNGANATPGGNDAGGGGGGGGVIHLLSPNANAVAGTLNVNKGIKGIGQGTGDNSTGGGGGASGGDGGFGGSTIAGTPSDGQNGLIIRTQISEPGGEFF